MASRGRGIGVALGAAATVAGAAFAAERIAARRLRGRDASGPVADLVAPFDELQSLPSHDGGGINVVRRGTGRPVLLSHGVTLSVRTWVSQLEQLPADGFEVIAFDHRGHGASTVGSEGHTIDALAWDVRTVLERLDLRDAILVGHSMGGVAVQAFCLRFPEVAAERVSGIVLLSTLARGPLHGNPRLRHLLALLAAKAPDGTDILKTRDLGLVIARIGFGRHPRASQVELTRQMILACDPATRRDSPAALIDLDLTAELPRITVPTLVVCGRADVLTPPSEARRIAGLIPGARLELVPGGGHMLMLEQPETLHRLIREFAAEIDASAELTTERAQTP
jgi:pimeloyl-ACP methyl ester carboxylesterase